MRVALDTNRLTDSFAGDAGPAEQLGICDEVWIPLNEALLQGLLAKPTVGVLPPGRETAEHCARLFVQLKTTAGLQRRCWNTISV